MNNNHQFDLFSFIVFIITIIISSVYFFYKRNEIKFTYKGLLLLIFIGTILMSFGFVYIVAKIPDWDINLIFDYLLFRNPNIFKKTFYMRTTGYFLVIVGIEFLFITLAKKRKYSSN